MKTNYMLIFINGLFLLFLLATFIIQYEHLFVTRIVLIVFTSVYLVIDIKKKYFSANKLVFISFSTVSITMLTVSILLDTANSMTNERVYFIPVYVFILIVMLYKDLFEQDKSEKAKSQN